MNQIRISDMTMKQGGREFSLSFNAGIRVSLLARFHKTDSGIRSPFALAPVRTTHRLSAARE